ncbi:hypothetical protein, partial [Klebsiella pneumoniae]|uniref:hypothetical protein n=1 Tax=Klebsiella pneumoniae TaxID=573 RepID=UPI003B984393
ATCTAEDGAERRKQGGALPMKLVLANANPSAVRVRITLGGSAARIGGLREARVKDGARIYETSVPGNARRELRWTIVDE